MQLLVLSSFFAVVVSAVPSLDLKNPEWLAYKSKHGKVYKSADEETMRLATYVEHKSRVDQHNERFAQGLETFELEINKFADVPQAEFAGRGRRDTSNVDLAKRKTTTTTTTTTTTAKPTKKTTTTKSTTTTTTTTTTTAKPTKKTTTAKPTTTTTTAKPIAETVDWRTKGAVTPVKDQRSCSAGYAFSVAGAVEGLNFRKTGRLVALSEQNIIDCKIPLTDGCKGVDPFNAMGYIIENNGIATEDSYPYTGITGQCAYNVAMKGATFLWGNINLQYNETDMAELLKTYGPVVAGIDASQTSFLLYRYGIYYEPACSATSPNHYVLVVGYGTDATTGLDYWIVKNSWGLNWGTNGYMYMARNRNNNCGIATRAIYFVN